MEEDEVFGEIDLESFMKRISKLSEENEKNLQEHSRSIKNQQNEVERQKQRLYSFVCDWQ
jgi:hypothetical protein